MSSTAFRSRSTPHLSQKWHTWESQQNGARDETRTRIGLIDNQVPYLSATRANFMWAYVNLRTVRYIAPRYRSGSPRIWRPWRDSNSRPSPSEGDALNPTELHGPEMVRVARFELATFGFVDRHSSPDELHAQT